MLRTLAFNQYHHWQKVFITCDLVEFIRKSGVNRHLFFFSIIDASASTYHRIERFSLVIVVIFAKKTVQYYDTKKSKYTRCGA